MSLSRTVPKSLCIRTQCDYHRSLLYLQRNNHEQSMFFPQAHLHLCLPLSTQQHKQPLPLLYYLRGCQHKDQFHLFFAFVAICSSLTLDYSYIVRRLYRKGLVHPLGPYESRTLQTRANLKASMLQDRILVTFSHHSQKCIGDQSSFLTSCTDGFGYFK